jgi:hypothetical protein
MGAERGVHEGRQPAHGPRVGMRRLCFFGKPAGAARLGQDASPSARDGGRQAR